MPTLIFSRVGACPPCSPRAGAHAQRSYLETQLVSLTDKLSPVSALVRVCRRDKQTDCGNTGETVPVTVVFPCAENHGPHLRGTVAAIHLHSWTYGRGCVNFYNCSILYSGTNSVKNS